VGTDLVRFIKFQGDRIILVTPPKSVNEKTQTHELVWERVPVISDQRVNGRLTYR